MHSLPSPGDHISDYTVVRERGRGGMAVVYEVLHRPTEARRALKLMLPGTATPETTARFLREFRALSRLEHPGILKVMEHGIHEGLPYLVMELLEGEELGKVVDQWKGLPPMERFRRARKVLIAVARALEYIHERGLVHRDVTPSNIMLLPDGSVKLMDFGIVKLPGGDVTLAGEVVGTVAYIAPEQAQDGPVDARADLYSLGVVFYLMLTGRRPFNARNAAGYLDKHLNRSARPPRELVPTIPELADEVCMRLLAKNPVDRFASATHLLHVLHAARPQPTTPTSPDWVPELVGRAAELGRVRAAVSRLVSPDHPRRGGLLIIEGVDGMGRNRVAAEAVLQARQEGIAISRARAQDPDQRAFELYRSLVEELLAGTGLAPPPAIAATFGDAGKERVERYAVMAAVAALASRSGPRLLLLHELQRADRPSIELTEYLVRNLIQTDSRPLLILITRPHTEDDAPDPLAELVSGRRTGLPADRVILSRLDEAAVEELVLTIISDSPAARTLASRLHKEGDGNPFYIREMIRALVEEGLIEAGKEGARGRLHMDLEAASTAHLPVPGNLRQVITERMAAVSADAIQVARVLAFARTELAADLVAQVTGFDEVRLERAIDEGVRARLLHTRRVDDAERLTVQRNRVRDVVIDTTPPEEQALIHRNLGVTLELRYRRNTPAVVENLAWHFEHARIPSKAYPYLLQAARKLASRSFLSEAMNVLDRARRLEPEARHYLTIAEADHHLVDLCLARASASKDLGNLPAATEEAREAHRLAELLDDRRLLARTETEMGILARQHNDLETASAHLRRALEHAGTMGDQRLSIVPLYEYGAVCWARGDLEGAKGYFEQCHASSEAYQDDQSLALGTNGLGIIALCKGQAAESRRYFEQSIEVCERAGLIDRLNVARVNLIEVHHLTGNLRKGMELADRTLSHAREVAHPAGVVQGLRCRAMLLTDLGRPLEAVENAQEAQRIQQGLSNPEDDLGLLVTLIRAWLAADHTTEAADLIDPTLRLAETSDAEGFAPVIWSWSARLAALAGQPESARAAIIAAQRAPGRRWPHQLARLHLNLARAHEALGETDQALVAATLALRQSDASGYRFYCLRAHQLLSRFEQEELARNRHAKVADALARSLAASLPREDADMFLEAQGVKVRRRRGDSEATTAG